MKLAANGTAAVREGHGGRVSVVGRQVAQERVLLTVARDCKVLHRLHIVTHGHEILGLYASLLDHIRCNVLLASEGLAHSLSSCIAQGNATRVLTAIIISQISIVLKVREDY